MRSETMKRCLHTLLLAVLFWLGSASGQHQHHAGQGAAPAGRTAELGASAAIDPQGILWAAHSQGGHVVLSRSGDFGATWSKPTRITVEAEGTDPSAEARPKVAAGKDGEIYVTWTRPR